MAANSHLLHFRKVICFLHLIWPKCDLKLIPPKGYWISKRLIMLEIWNLKKIEGTGNSQQARLLLWVCIRVNELSLELVKWGNKLLMWERESGAWGREMPLSAIIHASANIVSPGQPWIRSYQSFSLFSPSHSTPPSSHSPSTLCNLTFLHFSNSVERSLTQHISSLHTMLPDLLNIWYNCCFNI